MRQRRRGHIINITSIAGLIGFPGSGYYAASKHAVEGWSDSLAAEVNPLGIHVTCVEPGPFRTDWAGRSLRVTESRIDDYAATVAARMHRTKAISGTQAGDPDRAASIIADLTSAPHPPRRIVLGTIGLDLAVKALQDKLDEIQAWSAQGRAADYPGS
jgi:NAD(P)-dependent dehydrogenase (short-subunit alcohol dehydrogenase family)